MAHEPNERLDGRIAVIAGGTGAIGYAAARRLAAKGARVALLHRGGRADVAQKLAGLAGQGHIEITASITESAALAAAAGRVARELGGCDILVNSAGFTQPVPAADLEALTDELIDRVFAANWRGVFATIRAFVPLLRASGDGVIVNVSSIAAFTGVGSNLAYAASKAGIDVLGVALGKALAPAVRVLTVSPSAVESDFVPGRSADFYAKAAASTPLKRLGTPDDIAAAIEACCTTLAFATGTTIVVDGGRSL